MIGTNAGAQPRYGMALQNALSASRNLGVPDPTVYGVPKAAPSAAPPPAAIQPATAGDAPPVGTTADQRTDYAALLAQALGPQKQPSTFEKIASIAGPILLAVSGNGQMAQSFLADVRARRDERERLQREAALTAVKWRREDDLDAAKRNSPQYFSGNDDRVRYDPVTGQSTVVYDAPRDFEDYAGLAGDAGTPAYFNAAQDYVLRGHGPTAFQYDRDLETVRQAGRASLEAQRQGNRVSLEGVRQRNRSSLRGSPTYRDIHPQPGASRRPGPARPTATGPNGQKLEYDGKAWVPVS